MLQSFIIFLSDSSYIESTKRSWLKERIYYLYFK